MITNFFQIALPFQEFDVQRTAYTSERLNELRKTYNSTCSFFRDGEWIYISPATGFDVSLGETVRGNVTIDGYVVESLIRHLLFRVFRESLPDRIPLDFRPLRFLAKPGDLGLLPKELSDILDFRRVIEVHVRSIFQGGKRTFGLLINSRHRWHIVPSIETLAGDGFDVLGCTVLEKIPLDGLNGILAPDESVLGAIRHLNNGNAIIESNVGELVRPLSSLFLQRTHFQIAQYLSFRMGSTKAQALMSKARDQHKDALKPERHYDDIRKYGAWFSKQSYKNADSFTFTVTPNTEIKGNGFSLEPTKLLFGYTPGESALYPAKGLTQFGPCDSVKFDKKTPHILFIFNEKNHGAATEFLGKLTKGIPGDRYFGTGFKDLFRLHDVKTTLKPISGDTPEDYERAINEAIDSASTSFDIALVDYPDSSRDLPDPINPYVRSKAKLMSYGVPVQGIKTTHLRASDKSLSFSLGPTALQMYAKIGGIPWVLPASHTVDHELIVGIGNSIKRPNFWADADQSRVVGITTFFLGDGTYVLGEELSTVPYSDYLAHLVDSLERSLKDVSKLYWRAGNEVRIVFHIFKPLKNIEIEAVTSVVSRFPDFRIRFAFVTISQDHPWMMYESAREVYQQWEVAPALRGSNVQINENECLLQLQGPKDRTNKFQPPPSPVLIRLHPNSTYKDLHYISQQVQDFSYMCWRSYFPVYSPVTLLYANTIARKSAQLCAIPDWNPRIVKTHFQRKQWFL